MAEKWTIRGSEEAMVEQWEIRARREAERQIELGLAAQPAASNGHAGPGLTPDEHDPTDDTDWAGDGPAEEKPTELGALIQVAALRVITGDVFLAGDSTIQSVWGADNDILWAHEEPFLIVGPSGVGKSTLAQQITKARLTGGEVLGYPVTGDDRPILILAMDRAAQIKRSMQRMFAAEPPALLQRLLVWRGPLPFNVVKYPEGLAMLADQFGAGTILADSIKDMAPNMSNEETGSQINAAFQIAVNGGIDVLGLHHQRKAQGDNKKPTSLADVYGSQMLVNGAGSVVLLWGEAGDLVVEMSHLKQPAEQVGPLSITHDHVAGISTAGVAPDAYDIVQGADHGVTAQLVACRLYAKTEPTANERAKAYRRLEKLAADGYIHKQEPNGVKEPALYYPITRRPEMS